MKLLRSPVAQFLLFGMLLMVLISAGTARLAQDAAEDEALSEARDLNAVLARTLNDDKQVTRGLLRQEQFALEVYDRNVRGPLLADAITRVNVWTDSGDLLYTNAYRLLGSQFSLTPGQERVIENGGTGSELSDPTAPENVGTVGTPGMADVDAADDQVRIYTRVRVTKDRVPLLFEAYYTLTDLEDRRARIYESFRWITLGGPLLLVLIATPLIWVLTRRLTSAGKERERLLHSSLDASDAERRRIARDLHDGVVQDLAGSAFSVSAASRDPHIPQEARARLDAAGVSLRGGLKALRSLLVEIHPPDLHAEGLAAALADLIAPAADAGVQASVSVEGAETASDERAALVWRVAQEAVRNALRHADASTLAVTVRGDGTTLALEVVDDGQGFDQGVRRDNSFGLRGLRSLVAEAGGTLDVMSSPGEGTTVGMEVAAQ